MFPYKLIESYLLKLGGNYQFFKALYYICPLFHSNHKRMIAHLTTLTSIEFVRYNFQQFERYNFSFSFWD